MAKKMEHFSEFPKELRDNVWEMALIPAPGVHFIKPNTDYNGTFLEPASENAQYVYGPGIAGISPFSAACELARLSMVSREAKGRFNWTGACPPFAVVCGTAAASELSIRLPHQL